MSDFIEMITTPKDAEGICAMCNEQFAKLRQMKDAGIDGKCTFDGKTLHLVSVKENGDNVNVRYTLPFNYVEFDDDFMAAVS